VNIRGDLVSVSDILNTQRRFRDLLYTSILSVFNSSEI